MSARKKRVSFDELDVNPSYVGEDKDSSPEPEKNEEKPKKQRIYAFRPAKKRVDETDSKVYAVGFIPVYVVFAVCFALAAFLFVLYRQGLFQSLSERQHALLYAFFPCVIFLVPSIIYVFAVRKEGFAGLHVHRFSPAFATFLFLSLALMIAAVAAEKFSLACFFSGLAVREPVRLSFQNDFLINLILYVIVPVVCEELFFRGVLQTALSEAAGGFAGITVSALAYALIYFDLAGFPVYLTVGVLSGILRHVCGSIVPGMLVHAVFRFVSLTFSAQLSFIASERAGGYFVLVVLVLAVFVFLLFYLKSLEIVCTKKAVSVLVMQNDTQKAENDRQTPAESENLVVFRSKPFRLTAETGYTFHKFWRVLFSPALILAFVAYGLILFL